MGLLRHCKEILRTKGVLLDIVPTEMIAALPLLNTDEEVALMKQEGSPVDQYHKKLANADAFLFATCEYNGSISSAMKNAVDWGTRCQAGNLWDNKPVGIIGAGGYAGTTRAQNHLRDICHNVNMKNMNGSFGSGLEIRVQIFQDTPAPFDETTGDVKSDFWKNELEKSMTGLIAWTNRVKE
jgi:chromate reductase